MKEPTREEMIEGIAKGVKSWLDNEQSRLGAQMSTSILNWHKDTIAKGIGIAVSQFLETGHRNMQYDGRPQGLFDFYFKAVVEAVKGCVPEVLKGANRHRAIWRDEADFADRVAEEIGKRVAEKVPSPLEYKEKLGAGPG